ncbi:MAG: helix-turn-helix transcriptional regulator [Chloroflexota bacterium]
MIETTIRVRNERGSVQNAILALLAQRPRHGYELRDLFEAALGGHWELNSGQIYSSLERLARDGLVVEESIEKGGGPDKRLWAVTKQGEQESEGWFNSPVPRDYRLRDEFYLKLMLVLLTQPTRARSILMVQRRELYSELHDLTARRNQLDPKQKLAHILLLDSALMHTEAELRWLEMVEIRLDDIRGQPPPVPPSRPRGRPRKAR